MADEQLDQAQTREIISFQIAYNRQRMNATWVLAVIMVAIYLLEEYFGGSQNIAVLVRMGANVSERARHGEYYRMLTCVFLHAGFLHAFFNIYVLFALGGFFNRILGDAKYLTVFLFSGICGSLSSVFLGKSTVSVGASGAIWGLFGAGLALAMFKTPLLPEVIRLRLRRITLINLLINLGISFLPMIDFWAHIGGGVGGFLISLFIIFRPRTTVMNRFSTYFFRISAVLLSVLYAASLAYVFVTFQPWVNQLTAELKNIDLKDVPFSMATPVGLKQIDGPNNTKSSAYYIFGDPEVDRLVIEIHFFSQAILGSPANSEWLKVQREHLLKEGSLSAEVKKSVYLRDTSDGMVLYYQQSPKNGDVVIHSYVITKDGYAIKLDLVLSDKIAQADVDKVAKNIIGSIKQK